MANIRFLLQAATEKFHADEIKRLLEELKPTSLLFSVAFVREAGVASLEEALSKAGCKATLFVGIRNNVTSKQALARLLSKGHKVYAVDTGSRHTIFHPKLYLIQNAESAALVIGSANLTFNGLHNNVEASTIVTLDLNDELDGAFVQGVRDTFSDLAADHAEHVFKIDKKTIDKLFKENRLEDETIVSAPASTAKPSSGTRDSVPAMALYRKVPPAIKKAVKPTASSRRRTKVGSAADKLGRDTYELVWESNELSERDLNVLTGKGTHRTGSMLLKKGVVQGIDFRHYFRDVAFTALDWEPESRRGREHLERAIASVRLVVKGLDYGVFDLRLTHNTDTDSKTYRQRNAMTSISWGLAKAVVADRDLLGRRLSLFRNKRDPKAFTIEID